MKGNDKVLAVLNELLADELTAVNQYMVHSEMCANWKFDKLANYVEKRAIQEMKHAEMHIGRILFLEGTPIVSNLKPIHIGASVEAQLKNDEAAEVGAVKGYNEAIALAMASADNGSREMLESILKDEEEHLDWLEAQIEQISQIGLKGYLMEQI